MLLILLTFVVFLRDLVIYPNSHVIGPDGKSHMIQNDIDLVSKYFIKLSQLPGIQI